MLHTVLLVTPVVLDTFFSFDGLIQNSPAAIDQHPPPAHL